MWEEYPGHFLTESEGEKRIRRAGLQIALRLVGHAGADDRAAAKPIPYFAFTLPSPIALDPDLAKQFKDWHAWLSNAGLLGDWLQLLDGCARGVDWAVRRHQSR